MDEKKSDGAKQSLPESGLRVSPQERELAVSRLQDGFVHGYLNEVELDARIKSAFDARLRSELSALVDDLPLAAPKPSALGMRPIKKLKVHGGRLAKTGPWVLGSRLRSVLYKGTMVLDLRNAVLTSPLTRFKVRCYKSRLEIIVPRGCRIDMRGRTYKGSWDDRSSGGLEDGPLIRLDGSVYKGSVVVREDPGEEVSPRTLI